MNQSEPYYFDGINVWYRQIYKDLFCVGLTARGREIIGRISEFTPPAKDRVYHAGDTIAVVKAENSHFGILIPCGATCRKIVDNAVNRINTSPSAFAVFEGVLATDRLLTRFEYNEKLKDCHEYSAI